jgi:hypothetical protein
MLRMWPASAIVMPIEALALVVGAYETGLVTRGMGYHSAMIDGTAATRVDGRNRPSSLWDRW